MNKKYFYLALTPTNREPAFIYSKSFSITYEDSSDLVSQQSDYEKQFRIFNGNPPNYNAQWSTGYADKITADTNRTFEINALQSSGKIVKTSDFPQ